MLCRRLYGQRINHNDRQKGLGNLLDHESHQFVSRREEIEMSTATLKQLPHTAGTSTCTGYIVVIARI